MSNDSPLLSPSVTGVPESLGERIVVYFQLCDLIIDEKVTFLYDYRLKIFTFFLVFLGKRISYSVVLVSCDCDEFCLAEHICPKGAVRQPQDVISLYYMEPGLVLVHGVENCLQIKMPKD